jgi:hypothetical protein
VELLHLQTIHLTQECVSDFEHHILVDGAVVQLEELFLVVQELLLLFVEFSLLLRGGGGGGEFWYLIRLRIQQELTFNEGLNVVH